MLEAAAAEPRDPTFDAPLSQRWLLRTGPITDEYVREVVDLALTHCRLPVDEFTPSPRSEQGHTVERRRPRNDPGREGFR